MRMQEQAGKPNARLDSGEALKRADTLQARLQKRLEDLSLEHRFHLCLRWLSAPH